MKNVIIIETSTLLGEVALFFDGKFSRKPFVETASHTRMLIPFIEELLVEAGVEFLNIDTILVNRGPGSHTGVRIGLTTARMLCFDLDKTLLGISALETLALMASEALMQNNSKIKTLIPTVFCRKNELYFQTFSIDAVPIAEPGIISVAELQEKIADESIYVFGEGARKELDIENEPLIPNVKSMYNRASQILAANPSKEYLVKSLEPLYLHKILATPKNSKIR